MSEEQEEKAGVVDPETGAVVNPEDGSPGVAVEPVPEETPEKVEELRGELRFHKQRHQALIEDLNQYSPEFYAKWKDGQHQGAEQPAPETPVAPTVTDDDGEYLTVGQMRQMQQSQIKQIEALNAESRRRDQQAGLQAQYTGEYQAADAAILAAIEDLKLPESVVQEMHQKVSGYGINVRQPTGPSGYAKAFVDLAQTYVPPVAEIPQPGTSPEEIAVLDQARQTGMMQQPDGSRVGVQVPDTNKQKADDIAPDTPFTG